MNKQRKIKFITIGSIVGVVGVASTAIALGVTLSHKDNGGHKQHTMAEIAAKQTEWAHTLSKDFEKETSFTAKTAKNVLTNHHVEVDLEHGTSSKEHHIGNKYHAIDRMIKKFNLLTDKEKTELTIEKFAQLFKQNSDADERRYHTASIVKELLISGFEKEFKDYAIKKDKKEENVEEVAQAAQSMQVAKPYSYEHANALKYNDDFWTPKNISYTNNTIKGNGKTFYNDLAKGTNGKYPQFTIENWINVYDIDSKDILSDPKHIYAADAPKSYSASNIQFSKIYNNKANDVSGHDKEGNNNNGLNGIYSGAGFGWDDGKKTFDTTRIETLDGTIFSAAGSISNGWEHVSPQSKEKAALGNNTLEMKTAIGDLHNLRPSIQNLFNGPRGNNPFGMVSGDTTKNGVDFEIGSATFGNLTVTEPRVNVRGDIARIIFYMHDRYHVKYDLGYYKLMALWSAMDPVTTQEKALDNKIATVMGFHNEYVTGEKMIPYDQEIEAQVIAANKDKTANAHTWDIGPAKVINNEIDTQVKAAALDWSAAATISYGDSAPSHNHTLTEAVSNKQLILKATLADGTIHYFKASYLQSKAIIAREFGQNHNIKINVCSSSMKKLATLLTGTDRTSYASMTDEITSLQYLIVA